MLKGLKSRQSSIVGVILIWIVLWLKPVIGGALYFYETPPSLPMQYASNLLHINAQISVIFAALLVLVQALLLMRLNFRYIFLSDRGYFPAFIFILITSTFPLVQNFNPALIANLFLLAIIDKLFSAYKSERSINTFFDLGLILGLGAMFYLPLLALLPFIWISMLIIRQFYWREYLVLIMGIVLPFITLFSYYYLVRGELEIVVYNLIEQLGTNRYNFIFNRVQLIVLALFALLLFVANLQLLKKINRQKISTRKYFSSFFWLSINCLGLFFFFPNAGFELIYILAIPVSLLLGEYFMGLKSKFQSIVLFVILLLAIFINYFYDFIISVLPV